MTSTGQEVTEERSAQVAAYVELLKEQHARSVQAHAEASDDPEAWTSVALVQGHVSMALHMATKDSPFIAEVDVPQDFEGNYLDHVIVTTRGGHKVRVTFAPE